MPAKPPIQAPANEISRRRLLIGGGVGAGALTLGVPLLSSCSSDADPAAAPSAAPTSGGVLTLGISGGGASDTLDPLAATTSIDYHRAAALFDYGYWPDKDFVYQPQLVEESTANQDATMWTIRLREGIEFHNGKTMDADDLIFTLQRIYEIPFSGLSGRFAVVQMDGVRKVDARTVEIPMKNPFSIFPNQLAQLPIVPQDFDPNRPVGTGPFMYKSFSAGRESTFEKNPNWWGGSSPIPGTPYLDELVMVDLSDDTARVNALLSEQVDAIDNVPFGQGTVIEAQGFQLFNVPTGNWRPFTMRVDIPPFNDVRVRQAMRLIADREQLVQQALNGYGTIGNDLYSPQDPNFATANIAQREQDLEQARALLKDAGQENLEVELVTSAIAAGVVEASAVYATQAAEAGITVNVRKVDSTTFYGDQYLKWPFAVDWWTPLPYLDQAVTADGPDAAWNETHWDDPEFNSNYFKALKEPDPVQRASYEHEMMRIQHERGGYLIWGFVNTVDAHSDRVQGMVPTKYGQSFSDSAFWRLWVT